MDRIFFKISTLFLIVLAFSSCKRSTGYIAISGPAQGGTYTVKVNMEGVELRPEQVKAGIDSIISLIDNTLSGYNKGSELSRFNRGEAVPGSPMFRDIYSVSREYFNETGGAFDIAAGPLFDAWGFGFTDGQMPSDEKIDSLLSSCGSRLLPELLPETIDPSALGNPVLNYNAIAQGYSCDQVADYLYSIGAKDMLVDIGEIFCDGVNPSRKPWTIGVDKPIEGNQVLGAELQAVWQSGGDPKGVVTSGNYRKFYVRDGKKYSHTIDPRTGRPVEHNLLSATIVAPTAAAADAYATYCMVIGLEESEAFIESRPDLEGYLIYDADGQMLSWASAGFNPGE